MSTSCVAKRKSFIDEAKKKRRAKDYVSAETLSAQAIKMLKNAKPFQQTPEKELAEIHLAE